MNLEDEFLHRYLGEDPSLSMTWEKYQSLKSMLSEFMVFLEEADWIEEWDSDEQNTPLGEYIQGTVQCDVCGFVYMLSFPSNVPALKCPSCKEVATYRLI